MRIFISYPREFQEYAEKIEAELQNRHFDTFLDRHKINPSQAWTVEIERQIKRSKVYVILYDPAAAADETRYFAVEINHIRKQLEGSLKPIRRIIFSKHVVPVIFHPTTTKDLPAYLECRQAVEATTNEHTDKRKNTQWIYKVIKGVEKLRKEKQIRSFTLTMVAMLFLACIYIFLPSVLRSPPSTLSAAVSNPLKPKPDNAPEDPWEFSQQACKDLKGSYNLLGEYVYIEEPDLKATAVNGRWEATICKRIEEPKGTYILEGKEETTHLVRIKINNTYKQVNATNQSRSEITINKDGRLTDRRIFFLVDGKPKGDPVIDELDPIGTLSKREANHVEAKLKQYKKLVREKHEAAEKHMHCIPARGKNTDNQEVIASICTHNPSSPNSPYYIRAMVRHHFIREDS